MNSPSNFIIEPSNGMWGLCDAGGDASLMERLSVKQKPKKCYQGTQILVLNTTNICNLGCVYCSGKSVGSKDMMPPQVARKTIDRALEEDYVSHIVFHGSEPHLNQY
jgi:sulfatase maturation enzyme AslB (radical SAM superfamily)